MSEPLLPIPVTLKLEESSGAIYIYDSSGFILASRFGPHLITVLEEIARFGPEYIREQLSEYHHSAVPPDLTKAQARANVEAKIAQGIRIKRIPTVSMKLKKKVPLGIDIGDLLANFEDLL